MTTYIVVKSKLFRSETNITGYSKRYKDLEIEAADLKEARKAGIRRCKSFDKIEQVRRKK